MASQILLLFALAFINSCLTVGNLFSFDAIRAIQDLLQTPRCPPHANSSVGCCPTCLGLSKIQYNFISTVSYSLSLPAVIGSGVLTDRFGVAPSAIVGGISCVCGKALMLIGSVLGDNHWLAFGLILFGYTLLSTFSRIIYAVQFYVEGHFFTSNHRPLTMGSSSAFATGGSLLAYLTMSDFGHRHGTVAVFSVITAMSLITLVCSFGVVLIGKRLEKQYESIDDASSAKSLTSSQWLVALETLGDLRIVIVIIATGLASSVIVSFNTNGINFFIDTFSLEAQQASHYIAISLLVNIISSFVVGYFTRKFGLHTAVITLGGATISVAFLLFITTRVHPLVGLVMLGVAFPNMTSAAMTLLADSVTESSYGIALSWAVVLSNSAVALQTALTGVLVEDLRSRELGWTLSTLCLIGTTATVSGIGCILLVDRSNCGVWRKSEPPAEKDSQTQE